MDLPVLPVECWTLIADKISSHDLSRLTGASKSLHAVLSPHLYRYIDLSVHNIPPVTGKGEEHIAPCPPQLLDRQRAFMRLILHHKPEYASWVRSFTWTMCLHRACVTKAVVPEDELDSVVQFFSRLDRVLSIDIDGGSVHCYPPKPVPPLFPAASHIRLSGQMHYGLAAAILHNLEKTSLKILDICNLHERGHTRSGQNYQAPPIQEGYNWGLAAWDENAAEPIEEDWPAGSLPKQVPPGPMRHLLNEQLVARCTSLERLALCQMSIEMLHAYGLLPPGWYYPGLEIHEEWASFIQAVRPRHLIIQYDDVSATIRSELKRLWRKNTCRGNLPYHGDFDQKLLPLLKEGWPGLQRLELTYWLIAEMDMLDLVVRDETIALLGSSKEVEVNTLPWTYYHNGLHTLD